MCVSERGRCGVGAFLLPQKKYFNPDLAKSLLTIRLSHVYNGALGRRERGEKLGG